MRLPTCNEADQSKERTPPIKILDPARLSCFSHCSRFCDMLYVLYWNVTFSDVRVVDSEVETGTDKGVVKVHEPSARTP